MIVDGWRREERDGLVATSMRVRWSAGDVRTTIAVPPEYAGPEGDASPWVAALLLLAMTVHEDLEIDGVVSARMRRGLDRVATVFCAWDPRLRPALVTDGGAGAAPSTPAAGVIGMMSRGVDSVFSAAVERVADPLTALVHWRGLEPLHSAATADAEERECRAIADRVGLPLIVGANDLRAPLDRHTLYHDTHGSVLAGLGLALAGGAGRVVLPTGDSARSFGPIGSSPALDHFFSTEAVAIEHDFSGHGRMGKVALLATQRPDLLPHLKVCYHEDRPDNCGRCPKCVTTMCALVAAGGLEAATGFPPLDLDGVRAQRPRPLRTRHQWSEIVLALGTTGRHGELRRIMEQTLRRTAEAPPWMDPAIGFETRAHTRAVVHLQDGRPDVQPSYSAQPLPRFRMRGAGEAPGALLLRSVDLRARRHRYAAGAAPLGEPAGALGAFAAGAGVPLRLDAGGLPVHPPLRPAPSAADRAKWVLAPLAFAAVPLRSRARGVAARVRDLARPRRTPAGAETVAGGLHPEPGPGRVPLLLADHPVLPDRLLTTRAAEAADLGYGEPVVLGYLVDCAPVPPPCDVPWAHRYGLARRDW